MNRFATSRPMIWLVASLFALSFVASACSSSGDGAPPAPGTYSVQKDSIHFDGERYQLFWADAGGAMHRLNTQQLRMVRDNERTYLEVPQGGGDPVLHLREDEPITVDARDGQGAFSSPWFPFLLGATVGNAFGGRGGPVVINNPAPGERSYGATTPTYRYPPTGTFGRDEQLHGTVDTSKAQPPDYSKVQPSPYATAGQSSGTGGGVAASNKGATTGGVAASNKGGFASGRQSYTSRNPSTNVGAGSRGLLGGGSSTNKPPSGISGGKGIGGGRAPSVGRR